MARVVTRVGTIPQQLEGHRPPVIADHAAPQGGVGGEQDRVAVRPVSRS